MASYSCEKWRAERSTRLDELAGVHRRVGGTGRGRRFALRQVNHAYAVLLAAEFQGYCRDFHSECVEAVVRAVPGRPLGVVVRESLTRDRRLDRGNASPANLGADFGRFEMRFWAGVNAAVSTAGDQERLEELNNWRNAIVHQDFDAVRLGGTMALRLDRVRRWRAACDRLVGALDAVLRAHLRQLTGVPPW